MLSCFLLCAFLYNVVSMVLYLYLVNAYLPIFYQHLCYSYFEQNLQKNGRKSTCFEIDDLEIAAERSHEMCLAI